MFSLGIVPIAMTKKRNDSSMDVRVSHLRGKKKNRIGVHGRLGNDTLASNHSD